MTTPNQPSLEEWDSKDIGGKDVRKDFIARCHVEVGAGGFLRFPFPGDKKGRNWLDERLMAEFVSQAKARGAEEAYSNVAKWFRFPLRKGMKITKNIDGSGGLIGAGCEVCGGRLVFVRGKYPGDKRRRVCPTCAVEILESLYSNCANRQAYTDKSLPLTPQKEEKI